MSQTKDELENDLRSIINDGLGEMGIKYAIDFSPLMIKLLSYIARRDALVFNHAVQVGKGMER